jgi:hypothetical protein
MAPIENYEVDFFGKPADVTNRKGEAIEFQHSPMTVPECLIRLHHFKLTATFLFDFSGQVSSFNLITPPISLDTEIRLIFSLNNKKLPSPLHVITSKLVLDLGWCDYFLQVDTPATSPPFYGTLIPIRHFLQTFADEKLLTIFLPFFLFRNNSFSDWLNVAWPADKLDTRKTVKNKHRYTKGPSKKKDTCNDVPTPKSVPKKHTPEEQSRKYQIDQEKEPQLALLTKTAKGKYNSLMNGFLLKTPPPLVSLDESFIFKVMDHNPNLVEKATSKNIQKNQLKPKHKSKDITTDILTTKNIIRSLNHFCPMSHNNAEYRNIVRRYDSFYLKIVIKKLSRPIFKL